MLSGLPKHDSWAVQTACFSLSNGMFCMAKRHILRCGIDGMGHLWLNFMCRIVGTNIVHTKEKFGFITIFSSQKSALSISNIEFDKNDQQISYISKWAKHTFSVDFFVGVKITNEINHFKNFI